MPRNQFRSTNNAALDEHIDILIDGLSADGETGQQAQYQLQGIRTALMSLDPKNYEQVSHDIAERIIATR